MYCSNCGKQIDDKAYICVHCGVLTNGAPTPSAPLQSASSRPVQSHVKKPPFLIFCMGYPFTIIWMMLSKLVALDVPVATYFGYDSELLSVGLVDLFFRAPKIANKIENFVSLPDKLVGIYFLIMFVLAILIIAMIADLFWQIRGIIEKDQVNNQPNFIIPIIFSAFFIIGSYILKEQIIANTSDYFSEAFSIYSKLPVYVILVLSIVGKIMQSSYRSDNPPTNQRSLWTCSYCHTTNEINSNICSGCNRSRPVNGGSSILFWNCSYCHTENGASSAICSKCHRPRNK